MTDERGNQKGAQRHAEGQQGEKTRSRQQEQLHSGSKAREEGTERDTHHPTDGRHRLFEQREQHDEAEQNSEKNRLSSDSDAHGHDRTDFQAPGGKV